MPCAPDRLCVGVARRVPGQLACAVADQTVWRTRLRAASAPKDHPHVSRISPAGRQPWSAKVAPQVPYENLRMQRGTRLSQTRSHQGWHSLRHSADRMQGPPEIRELRFPGHSNAAQRSEEHTSELQSRPHLVCRLLLEKKKSAKMGIFPHTTKKNRRGGS